VVEQNWLSSDSVGGSSARRDHDRAGPLAGARVGQADNGDVATFGW